MCDISSGKFSNEAYRIQAVLRLHVDHLRNPTLHDEKMGVVHIQRHRMKPQWTRSTQQSADSANIGLRMT